MIFDKVSITAQTIMHTHVTLAADRVNFPLRPVYVGQYSNLKIHLTGAIPEGAKALITVTPVNGGDAWSLPSAETAGGLEVFFPGWAFPDPGQTSYEVTVLDGENSHWMGRGVLTVISATPAGNGTPVKPPSLDGQWWFVKETGLWHKIELVIDEDTNLPTFKIGGQGYEEVPQS